MFMLIHKDTRLIWNIAGLARHGEWLTTNAWAPTFETEAESLAYARRHGMNLEQIKAHEFKGGCVTSKDLI